MLTKNISCPSRYVKLSFGSLNIEIDNKQLKYLNIMFVVGKYCNRKKGTHPAGKRHSPHFSGCLPLWPRSHQSGSRSTELHHVSRKPLSAKLGLHFLSSLVGISKPCVITTTKEQIEDSHHKFYYVFRNKI